MKALSIRQPWCWFILNGYPPKDFENRDWPDAYAAMQLSLCPVGSNFQIHASKGMTVKEFDEACEFAAGCGAVSFPRFEELHRGGIVGISRLVGVFRKAKSKWFTGRIGLKLEDSFPLPFIPCKGALGFFEPAYYDTLGVLESQTSESEESND